MTMWEIFIVIIIVTAAAVTVVVKLYRSASDTSGKLCNACSGCDIQKCGNYNVSNIGSCRQITHEKYTEE